MRGSAVHPPAPGCVGAISGAHDPQSHRPMAAAGAAPLLLALCTAPAAAAPPLLAVDVASDGSFSVKMGGTQWLASAAPRLFSGGQWANLTLLGSAPALSLSGGFGVGTAWRWSASGAAGPAVWETAIRKSSGGAR